MSIVKIGYVFFKKNLKTKLINCFFVCFENKYKKCFEIMLKTISILFFFLSKHVLEITFKKKLTTTSNDLKSHNNVSLNKLWWSCKKLKGKHSLSVYLQTLCFWSRLIWYVCFSMLSSIWWFSLYTWKELKSNEIVWSIYNFPSEVNKVLFTVLGSTSKSFTITK